MNILDLALTTDPDSISELFYSYTRKQEAVLFNYCYPFKLLKGLVERYTVYLQV